MTVITGEKSPVTRRSSWAQAIEGQAGVALQRTSPTMAGVFIRGLVGSKVNVFIDGGVNTFLDLVEASSLDSIEYFAVPPATSTAVMPSAAASNS